MKSPEQVFTEYAADEIRCFHGHTVSCEDFAACCQIFVNENFGIWPSYFMRLRQHGVDEDTIRVLNAVKELELRDSFREAAIKWGYSLNRALEARLGPYFKPKWLMRFETEDEALKSLPSYSEVIDALGKADGLVEEAKEFYDLFAQVRINKITESHGWLMLGFTYPSKGWEGSRSGKRITEERFIAYLNILTERNIVKIDRWTDSSRFLPTVHATEAVDIYNPRVDVVLETLARFSTIELPEQEPNPV